MSAEHTVLAWKFLRPDHKLRYDDGRELRAGETLRDPLKLPPDGVPVLCESGFHASMKARDALWWAPGAHIARVRIGGNVVRDADADKLAGTEIECLWIADATKALRLFMVGCRWRQAITRLCGAEPSLAVLWALDCAERYINGEADEEELQAAADAAHDAYDAAAAYYATHDAAAAYAAAADDYAYASTIGAAAAVVAARLDADADATNNELTDALLALGPAEEDDNEPTQEQVEPKKEDARG